MYSVQLATIVDESSHGKNSYEFIIGYGETDKTIGICVNGAKGVTIPIGILEKFMEFYKKFEDEK